MGTNGGMSTKGKDRVRAHLRRQADAGGGGKGADPTHGHTPHSNSGTEATGHAAAPIGQASLPQANAAAPIGLVSLPQAHAAAPIAPASLP